MQFSIRKNAKMKTLQIETPNSFMNNFMEQMKSKCQAKASQIAAIELSIWDEKHENDLKTDFGFNDKTLAQRKSDLINESNGIFKS